MKENIDFEEKFDYDNYVCVDGKCIQLEISISDCTCAGCLFIDCSGDECETVCPSGNKIIQFKR